jgi:hypothetical protein
MKLPRCIPAADGGSQLVEIDIPVDEAFTDAHGNPVFHRSDVLPAQSVMLAEMPEGMMTDWHPPSRRQLAIILSGTAEVEASDGTKRLLTAGQILVADNVGSRGHRTRRVGGPVRVLFVHLPSDAGIGENVGAAERSKAHR